MSGYWRDESGFCQATADISCSLRIGNRFGRELWHGIDERRYSASDQQPQSKRFPNPALRLCVSAGNKHRGNVK